MNATLDVAFSCGYNTHINSKEYSKMKQEYSDMKAAFNCAELAHWFEIRCKLYRTNGIWVVEFN